MIPLKQMTESAELRWCGQVTSTGDERSPKVAWQARMQTKRLRIVPRQTWEEAIQKIFKEGRAMARDRERWKALCQPSTATGRRGWTKGSEVKQVPLIHAF